MMILLPVHVVTCYCLKLYHIHSNIPCDYAMLLYCACQHHKEDFPIFLLQVQFCVSQFLSHMADSIQRVSGGIILAPEGINGSICGTPESVEKVLNFIQADERLRGLRLVESPVSPEDEAIHHGHTSHSPLGAGEDAPFRWDHVRVKLKKEVLLTDPEILHSFLCELRRATYYLFAITGIYLQNSWCDDLFLQIVTFGDPRIRPTKMVGQYVKPSDWNALISDPDIVSCSMLSIA